MKFLSLHQRKLSAAACVSVFAALAMALPRAALSAPVISVDLQSSYGTQGIAYSGVETGAAAANAGFAAANVWNALGTSGFTITNYSSGALMDNGGAATGAVFSITGNTSAFGVPAVYGALLGDYFYWGNGGLSKTIGWQVSGLAAGANYAFYSYGSNSNAATPREYAMTVDSNGDDVINDLTVTVSSSAASSGVLVYLKADAAGVIHGSNTAISDEANWAGFQLTQAEPPASAASSVPEPSSLALVLAPLMGLGVSLRKMRGRLY